MTKLTLTHYDYDAKETVQDAEVNVRQIAKALTPETMAELLGDYVNNFLSDYRRGQETGRMLNNEHPTLQRSVIVELLGIIAGMSETGRRDPRNQEAIELAEKIKALYEKEGAGRFI